MNELPIWFPIIFCISGSACLIGAVWTLVKTSGFLARAVEIDAKILALHPVSFPKGKAHAAEVEVDDVIEGKVEVFRLDAGFPPGQPGEVIRILYARGDPPKGKKKAFFPIWGAFTVLTIVGVTHAAIGFGLLYVMLNPS